MAAIAFDTLAYCRTLQEAGMDRRQAEALAQAQKSALDEMLAAREVATQADILRLEARVEANKHELLKWIIALLVAQGGFLVAAISYVR